MLDSRLPGELASNWTLKAAYIGRYDKAQQENEAETIVGQEIAAAQKRGQNVEGAIWQIVDDGKIKKSERTVWTIWQKIKLGGKWRALFAKAPDSEAARRTIAERFSKRKG
jgi:hypothetical protein